MYTPKSTRKLAGTIRHRLMLSIELFRHSDQQFLQRVLAFAEGIYDKKYRKPTKSYPERGVPLVVHPMRVALILIEELEFKDLGAVSGSILHDVIETERDKVTIADIEKNFGRPIAMLVSILTKPAIEPDDSDDERVQKLATYHKRLEQASVLSKLVKLADRLDTIREAPDWLNKDEQRRYLDETRAIFIPIAEGVDTYLLDEITVACDALEAALGK